MNKQLFKENGKYKFPISTDTFDFMQEQIFMAYKLSALVGNNVIIQSSTASRDGLCIVAGELLPLKGTPDLYIRVRTTEESIVANGGMYDKVRITRYAQYQAKNGATETYPSSIFWSLTNLQTLKEQLDEANKHRLPKGSVIAWSGTCDCDHVPYGYIPCGAFYGVAPQNFGSGSALGTAEQNKWKAKYPNNITCSSKYVSGKVGVLITQCNGVTIPDLTDRFIVQAGGSYDLGNTGGAPTVALTVDQMPKHNHDTATSVEDGTVSTGTGGAHAHKGAYKNYQNSSRDYGWPYISQSNDNGTHDVPWGDGESGKHSHSINLKARGEGQAHENRPPFYALCYLIKVI